MQAHRQHTTLRKHYNHQEPQISPLKINIAHLGNPNSRNYHTRTQQDEIRSNPLEIDLMQLQNPKENNEIHHTSQQIDDSCQKKKKKH